jgi:hypothetical protein
MRKPTVCDVHSRCGVRRRTHGLRRVLEQPALRIRVARRSFELRSAAIRDIDIRVSLDEQ